MTVDAHFHIWDPATRDHAWLSGDPVLDRHFGIDGFTGIARANGIAQAVLVQVLNDLDETREFLALAAAHEIVAGVVGWVDLEAPDVADVLARLREAPGGARLVGVRHLVQSEPDPGYLERSSVQRGLRATAAAGLTFDLLVRPEQLPGAIRAVRALGGLTVVLDHGAKPPLAGGQVEPWSSLVAELAGLDHVVCKLSGLVTEAGAGWTSELLRPYVDRLLECFGPARLLFGSDWPVSTAVARYDEIVGLVDGALAVLAEEERDAIMAGTARRVYGLAPPAPSPADATAPATIELGRSPRELRGGGRWR